MRKLYLTLIMIAGFHLSLSALDVYDTLIVTDNATINEDVHVHPGGVIRNQNNSPWSLTINGDLINEGSITDTAPYNLTVNLNGDLSNSGTINCTYFTMNGSVANSINSSSPISSYSFTVYNSAGLIADGDIAFSNCGVNFNNYTLDITSGNNILVDGGYIFQANIVGIASSEINMSNSAYLDYVDITNCTLTGTTEIARDCHFYGDIVNNGTIQNYYNSSYLLNIHGNIANFGSVVNQAGGYSLNVDCYGNIENHSIWSANQLNLYGTSSQTIYTLDGSSFTPVSFNNYNLLGIIAGSDLKFVDCVLSFNSSTLDLTSGNDLTIDGGYVYQANFNGIAATEINMTNSAYLDYVNITDCTLTGTTEIARDCWFYGDIVNNGTIQNYYNSSYLLSVDGNITNYGSVINQAGGYILNVDCYGNIENHSTWSANELNFRGTTPQTIYTLDGSYFSPYYFSNFNNSGIIAGSDLKFSDCRLDFNNLGNLDLATNSCDIVFDGQYFYRGTILGSTTAKALSTLSGLNDFYLAESTISNITLTDSVLVTNGVVFEGQVVNNGKLQNRTSFSYTITINGDFTNNSIYRSNPEIGYTLSTDFFGENITNNGIWDDYVLHFKGSSVQNVFLGSGLSYSSDYVNSSNDTTGVIAKTDLTFENSYIDFQTNDLDINEGYLLTVKGGYLTNVNLLGDNSVELTASKLSMKNGAYIQSAIINTVDLQDTILVGNDANIFNGPVTNRGVVQNHPGFNYRLTLNNDFINEGSVENALTYYLTVDVNGNITNAGIWSNYYTKLVGDTEQNVVLINNNIFDNFYFSMFSEFTTSPYQWYRNGEIFDSTDFYGEQGNELYSYNIPIDSTYAGTYYCITGEGQTRNIIISSMVYESPEIVSVTNNETTLLIQWVWIAEAISYDIYSSSDPYADSTTWNYEGSQINLKTKAPWVEWSEPSPADLKKFYYVKAIY